MPKLKNQPPFRYYGSKGLLAGWIASHIPEHRNYVEPFAGSAAVLLAKPPSYREIINDLNGDVVNFWRVLRSQHEDLVHVLECTPYAREEYLDCRDTDASDMDAVERARRFFVRCNMAFNASPTRVGFSFGSANTTGLRAHTFATRVDSRLSEIAERIRRVEIENTDALTIITRWNNEDTVMYLDPPYLGDTRASSQDYATDAPDADFHTQLMGKIGDFKGTVLLSGYDNDLYATLGWEKATRDVYAGASNKIGSRRTECLWINR
ncbi:DNA adenine methylase [Streptomyces malaysiensis]